MTAPRFRVALVVCATLAVVAALFALRLDAASGTRLVAAYLSFLATWAPRPRPPAAAGVERTAAASSSSPATAVERAMMGAWIYIVSDALASIAEVQ